MRDIVAGWTKPYRVWALGKLRPAGDRPNGRSVRGSATRPPKQVKEQRTQSHPATLQ